MTNPKPTFISVLMLAGKAQGIQLLKNTKLLRKVRSDFGIGTDRYLAGIRRDREVILFAIWQPDMCFDGLSSRRDDELRSVTRPIAASRLNFLERTRFDLKLCADPRAVTQWSLDFNSHPGSRCLVMK